MFGIIKKETEEFMALPYKEQINIVNKHRYELMRALEGGQTVLVSAEMYGIAKLLAEELAQRGISTYLVIK